MSGNCATGIRSSAIRPASVIMTAMTTANRGRSTKTEEIMSPSVLLLTRAVRAARLTEAGRGIGRRLHRGTGPHALHTVRDHDLAGSDTGRYHGEERGRITERYVAPLRLVPRPHSEDIVPLLIGQHGGTRHGDLPFRVLRLQNDGDEAPID